MLITPNNKMENNNMKSKSKNLSFIAKGEYNVDLEYIIKYFY
tara:strand:- start:398 stop:523 length:126 start_codon:yes stop_codon:yes gene_type:complete